MGGCDISELCKIIDALEKDNEATFASTLRSVLHELEELRKKTVRYGDALKRIAGDSEGDCDPWAVAKNALKG